MNELDQLTYDRLIEKSKEAFAMAIEVYNRPTVKYRVEGFSFFICNAWELMLKAKILRDEGRDELFYKNNPGRTKDLERCISMVFTNNKDPLRKNLEDIIKLRNTSTHFIVQEHEQIYIDLFHSCVRNFDDKMAQFHGVNMGDVVPPHFLSLSMTASPATPETIRAKYPPEIAEKFLFDRAQIEQEQVLQANQRYSLVVRTELAVVRNPKNADFTVAYDNSSDTAIRTAKVFQDPSTTHPYATAKIIDLVNRRLKREAIVLKANGHSKKFTTGDWSLFMKFYNLKDDKRYGYRHEIGAQRSCTYSMQTVDFIVGKIKENPDGIIDDLKSALKTPRGQTPGAKEFSA